MTRWSPVAAAPDFPGTHIKSRPFWRLDIAHHCPTIAIGATGKRRRLLHHATMVADTAALIETSRHRPGALSGCRCEVFHRAGTSWYAPELVSSAVLMGYLRGCLMKRRTKNEPRLAVL